MSGGAAAGRARPLALWVAAAASIAAVGAAVWRFAAREPVPPSFEPPVAGETPAVPPSAEELVRQRYNLVLQVRAMDAEGRPLAVGARLPREYTLVFLGEDGRAYAQRFDRVGQWATEIPAGRYEIPAVQEGLGSWRWTLSGEAVSPRPGGGWRIRVEAGKMNPMLDLVLR